MDIEIAPNDFIIITKNSIELISKYSVNPEQIYTTNLPTLNNTDDEVVLRTEGVTIDSLHYDSDWGEKPNSLERINYFAPSTEEHNWSASETLATPLQVNSVSRYIDLRIADVSIEGSGLLVVIENIGNIKSDNFVTSLTVNSSLIGDYQGEVIDDQSDSELYLDFAEYSYLPQVDDEILLEIISEQDVDKSNNKFKLFVPNQTKKNDILINEIMYDIDDLHFEFIEIYNNTQSNITISNWFIADEADISNNRYNQITTNTNLSSGEYAAIVCDSLALNSIENSRYDKLLFTKRKFSLNKSSDIICIYNGNKQLIDSLSYSDDWHEDYLIETKNISLEKVRPSLLTQDSDNWKSCTDESGNTLLIANSYSDTTSTDKNISALPNPFSPTSSTEPYIVIDYKLPFENALVDCDIYFPNGTKAVNVERSKFSSRSGIITWNGRDLSGNLLPIGPYVALINATNQDTGESEALKIVIVIAN